MNDNKLTEVKTAELYKKKNQNWQGRTKPFIHSLYCDSQFSFYVPIFSCSRFCIFPSCFFNFFDFSPIFFFLIFLNLFLFHVWIFAYFFLCIFFFQCIFFLHIFYFFIINVCVSIFYCAMDTSSTQNFVWTSFRVSLLFSLFVCILIFQHVYWNLIKHLQNETL